jgi:hypothetical protein
VQIEDFHRERLGLEAKLQEAYEATRVWSIEVPAIPSSTTVTASSDKGSGISPSALKPQPSAVAGGGVAYRLSFPSPMTFESPPTEQKFVARRAVSASPSPGSRSSAAVFTRGGLGKLDELLAQGFFSSPASSPAPRVTVAQN